MSVLLGVVGMGAWLIPIAGALFSVGALYAGSRGMKEDKDGWSLAGIILGGLTLVLTILRSGLVYYHG